MSADVPRTGGMRGAALRACFAAAAAGLAFFVLREQYRGECLWLQWDPLSRTDDDQNQFIFLWAFGLIFLVSFVWLVAEIMRIVATPIERHVGPWVRLVGAVAVGVALYAAVAAIMWQINPIPHDSTGDQAERLFLSAFWSIGLLQETGNYSAELCGY